jgi:mannose-6-phosphate isomerase-like protein (cupin superfamily)
MTGLPKKLRHYRFSSVDMKSVVAHDGRGLIQTNRVESSEKLGQANFIDITIVESGASIGYHSHGDCDEEIYIVISGRGSMIVDGVDVEVGPGDVIVNWPGGSHGVTNTHSKPLHLVVIDIPVTKRGS